VTELTLQKIELQAQLHAIEAECDRKADKLRKKKREAGASAAKIKQLEGELEALRKRLDVVVACGQCAAKDAQIASMNLVGVKLACDQCAAKDAQIASMNLVGVKLACDQCAAKDAKIVAMDQAGSKLQADLAKCAGNAKQIQDLQERLAKAEKLNQEYASKEADANTIVAEKMEALAKPFREKLEACANDKAALEKMKRELEMAQATILGLQAALTEYRRDHSGDRCTYIDRATQIIIPRDEEQKWKGLIDKACKTRDTSMQRTEQLLEAVRLQHKVFVDLATHLFDSDPLTWDLHNILLDAEKVGKVGTDNVTLDDLLTKVSNDTHNVDHMPRTVFVGFNRATFKADRVVWAKFCTAFSSPEDGPMQFLLNMMSFWRANPRHRTFTNSSLAYLLQTRAERYAQTMDRAVHNAAQEVQKDFEQLAMWVDQPFSTPPRAAPAPSSSHTPSRRFLDMCEGSSTFSFASPQRMDTQAPFVASHASPGRFPSVPATPPSQWPFGGGSAPVSPAQAPQPRRGAGPSRAAAPRGGGDDWTPSDRMPIASTVHMNLHLLQRPLPPNHKRALITVTQKISAATQNQYKLHACIGHRDKETAEVEITWSGIMPSNAYNNHPVTGKNYHYYQMGPRIHDITEFGDIAVLNEMEGAQYGTDPLVKDVRALVNVLAEKQEYFPGIRDVSVDKGAPVAEFVSLVFPQFVRFVRMFHGVSTFEMTSDSLATLTKAGRAQQSNTATKLKHPRLILLLPQSCMMGDVITTDDREYKWPSDWRIVWADLAEESS
jgi:hypothetical protein